MLQSDFSVKVKDNTKRRRQMTKKLAQGEDTIPSLNLQGGAKWHTNRVIDNGRRHKYQQTPI